MRKIRVKRLTTLRDGPAYCSWRGPTGHTYQVTLVDRINVKAALDYLLPIASHMGVTTFGDLAQVVGINRQGAAMTRLLDLLSLECHLNGHLSPAICVVYAASGKPGTAYVFEPGLTWQQEQRKVHRYWWKLRHSLP